MSTLSIRLRPAVRVLLDQRCKQQRVNRSSLVNDLIEQALGLQQHGERSAALLDALLSGIDGSGDPRSAKNISARLKKSLRATHAAR